MSAPAIQDLTLKVLELYKAGIDSLDMRTSGPGGGSEYPVNSGKAGKFERSTHARVFSLQHSIKSISEIMNGDVEELNKQIRSRHDDLSQKSLLLDICLSKLDDQTTTLKSKIYPHLNELEISPLLKDRAQKALLTQEADLAPIIDEECAAREAALANLNALQEKLNQLTEQIQKGITADTIRINTLSKLYSTLQSDCLNH